MEEKDTSNISEDTMEVSISSADFDSFDFSRLKKLKRITIVGKYMSITREVVDKLLRECPSLEKVKGMIKINDPDLKKDSIFCGDSFSFRCKYQSLLFESSYFSSSYVAMYSRRYLDDLDSIFNVFSMEELSSCKTLRISDKMDLTYLVEPNIKYSLRDDYEKNLQYRELSIRDVDNISDVLKIVSLFKEKNIKVDRIVLHLKNKDYDNIYFLKKIEKEYNFSIMYEGSLESINLNDYIAMRETLRYYRDMILEANLSNLEKIMFAYDLIKSFKYKEVDDGVDKANSRNIHSIIREGNIVCVGYSVFFSQLLKELGIESYTFSTSVPVGDRFAGHARTLVNVQDDKYHLDGFFAFDPTWDCDHEIVKCLSDGKEVIKTLDEVTENDRIIKHYDGMILYRYFLISRSMYSSVFPGEEMPKLHEIGHYGIESELTSIADSKMEFRRGRYFDTHQFMDLIKNVKLKEGYSMEEIIKMFDDIFEFTKLYQQEEWDTQKKR